MPRTFEQILLAVTMGIQIWIQFIVAPVINGGVAFINWCARNVWLLFSGVMLLVFYLSRMGLFAESIREPLLTLMHTSITFGPLSVYVAELLMVFIAFTFLIFCYTMIRPTLILLYERLLQILSTLAICLLFIYSRVFGTFADEFVVLEGTFTVKDFLKFAAIIVIIIGFAWMYSGLKEDQGSKFADQFAHNITDVNGSIISDEQIPDINFTINLTTEKYGHRTVPVSALIDCIVNVINQNGREIYGV